MSSDGAARGHRRLFGLTAAGAALIALGVAVSILGVAWWPLRLGVLGAMLLIFGLAGYVAIAAFQPQHGS